MDQEKFTSACYRGDYVSVKDILSENKPTNEYINQVDEYNSTPLKDAIEHIDVVKLLLENGADINADGGDTLRYTLTRGGYDEVAKLLIEKGADVNAVDREGNTPIIFASRGGDLEIVKLLIEKGADVNVRGGEALKYAIINGHTETADMLKNKIDDHLLRQIKEPEIKLYEINKKNHEKTSPWWKFW